MNSKDEEQEDIPGQDQLYSDETKRLHQAGINIVKYKAALKELVGAIQVTDALVGGPPTQINIHWLCYDVLGNWLRAEFNQKGRLRIMRWPWGNWWDVRATQWNPETETTDVTVHRLVIK